jgi:hypothetical protein
MAEGAVINTLLGFYLKSRKQSPIAWILKDILNLLSLFDSPSIDLILWLTYRNQLTFFMRKTEERKVHWAGTKKKNYKKNSLIRFPAGDRAVGRRAGHDLRIARG